jgi:8-oxo-dGTP diphosphatase
MKPETQEPDRLRYVLGFAFSPDFNQVLLICKNKPHWQAGKHNGLGGRIEDGESSEHAMYREFYEEAGVEIFDWVKFCNLIGEKHGQKYSVDAYHVSLPLEHCRSQTSEPIMIFPVSILPPNILPNVRWLIEMALSNRRHGAAETFTIIEHQS